MRRSFAIAFASITVVITPARADDEAPKPAPTVRPYIVHASSEIAGYVDNDHVYVVTPSIAGRIEDPVAGWSVQGRYLVDVVSAASVDVVSTATPKFQEVRQAATFTGTYKPSVFGVSATVARSAEPDYFSWVGGAAFTYDLNDKNETLLLGYAYARDEIGRHGTPFDVFSHDLDRHTLDGGITFVVDRDTVAAVVFDGIFERGDSSKPYRFIPMFSANVAPTLGAGASIAEVNALRLPEKPLEQLPLARDRFALTGRIAHHFAGSVVRASERLYADTWGVAASTTDATLLFDLTRRWAMGPHLRFHAQKAASFWRRAYVAAVENGAWTFPALRTGDRELSGMSTVTIGNAFEWALGGDLRPRSWLLTSQLQIMWTHFRDAVFITDRTGILFSLGVEAEL